MRRLPTSFLLIVIAALGSRQQLAAQQPTDTPSAPSFAVPADATTNSSGLATKVLKPGTGTEHPVKDDLIVADYTGWTSDGKILVDAQPGTLTLSRVLPGLSEGIQLMVVGETRRLWVPESLAFKGQKGKPAGPIVFDITLLDIPLRTPADLAHPPADAERTATGMYYKVLRPGTGKHHPKKADEVTVNYTGWTLDGKMFDSSYTTGAPATFPLDRVIAGWTEGLALMVEGEKTRFWIPAKLAYQGKKGPQGTLVFDIELLRIR